MPEQQWREREGEQDEAEGVYLRVVAVVEEVEDAGGERFAAGRHDEHHGFDIPQAEKKDEIPQGGELGRDLGPMDVAEKLPAGGAIETGGVGEVAVGGAHGVGDAVPAEGEVTDGEGEDDDAGALVEGGEDGAVEDFDEDDADEDARH